MITYLNVPYAEKDEAKRLGARWNPSRKTWYVENVESLSPFLKWIDEDLKKPVSGKKVSNNVIKVWTDGACHRNPGAGGWGWHSSKGESRYGGEELTTNNRMEMTAILEALRALPDGESVVVHTDSQYCSKGLTIWRKGWKRKNWMKNGKPMLNRDLWLLLEEQLNRLQVTVKWVKGHNGDAGNEEADRLAGLGVMMVTEPFPPEMYRF